ncbi:uncharacterized protein VTP21DRAFT_11348 [Calcarisporiella thermophila]|uniref:uncharacterized protein n=1 Tax=Calcarisporiella thermophila TaxID=911321 RepID=UPI003742FAA5
MLSVGPLRPEGEGRRRSECAELHVLNPPPRGKDWPEPNLSSRRGQRRHPPPNGEMGEAGAEPPAQRLSYCARRPRQVALALSRSRPRQAACSVRSMPNLGQATGPAFLTAP